MATSSNNNPTSNENASKSRDVASGQETKLEFSEDEKALIARMHKLLGDRWSLIAGRIPGRTAEDIKVYWTSNLPTDDSETKK